MNPPLAAVLGGMTATTSRPACGDPGRRERGAVRLLARLRQRQLAGDMYANAPPRRPAGRSPPGSTHDGRPRHEGHARGS